MLYQNGVGGTAVENKKRNGSYMEHVDADDEDNHENTTHDAKNIENILWTSR